MRAPETATALRIYYNYTEIGNREIKELFGDIASATITKLKNKARGEMKKSGVITCLPKNVNTKAVYLAWGFDIEEMERLHRKSQKLGITRMEESQT